MTILRRTPDGNSHPVLDNIRVITCLDDIGSVAIDFTLNCTVANALVSVQERLVRKFPRALHFCDTPIFFNQTQLLRAARLSLGRLHSLEDWPLMPNLAYFVHRMRRETGRADLRIENFGILTHFLSIYRSIHGGWCPFGRGLKRNTSVVAGELDTSRRVTFRYVKDLPRAKIFFRSADALIEDFHEVETQPHQDEEVLYRVIGDASVAYHRGAETFHVVGVDHPWIAFFEPFSDRKNVHELDKFIGLLILFRALLSGDACRPYSYGNSARDRLTELKLKTSDRFPLI